ncbi:MAG TPA: TetR/AcrR family transcriptional regulator [Kaistella chaponensis]|uniref:TetR/AcrR family transcriptional regulator n=1 Tax=Kaistella chaponensis TaxID=713588 RepID=UPI002C639F09|nr:TetR/AcrR family transcriptional regulator [Kaistella chaponensis]HPW89347.1 TetR/AcrR family transcriptional regulator [Kaistella chaponensis]HQC06601.1 TetR/AcrR family transcriptional regulator [Kaistella chaponensis]
MEEKTNFLSKATQLFIENGAKSVTMDEIAKEFGISKKTLYQKYKNKEELLEEVLKYKLQEVIERLKYLDENIDNAVARMFCRDEEIDKVSHSNNNILIRQLLKYYPAIFHKHMLNFSTKFSEVLVHNIEKGRKQGLYREDFDPELYAKLFFQLVMSYESSPYFDVELIERENFMQETMFFYLNAITNEKGKEVLKNLKQKLD